MTLELISTKQAAKQLGLNKETLLRAIRAGELEAIQLGYGYKMTPAALERWIISKTVNAAPAQQQTA